MAIRDDSSRGLLLVAGATFFWSLSGVFARWLPQVDPWTFNATRGLGMGIALLLWMAWKYRLGAIALFRQSDPVALLISGGFFAAGSSMYILALQLSSVAAASCIGATSGIFAAIGVLGRRRDHAGDRADSLAQPDGSATETLKRGAVSGCDRRPCADLPIRSLLWRLTGATVTAAGPRKGISAAVICLLRCGW